MQAQAQGWSNASDLTPARYDHTSTLLPNGKVLIAGGWSNGPLASAQVYDPASNSWSDEVGMTARHQHTATLLPNGKVLIAGGGGALDSAQVYDPANGNWSDAWNEGGARMAARSSHTATLLPNGKVLIAGGTVGYNEFLASAQVYDPASNSWSDAGEMTTARTYHTATLLPNGKVLIAGGYNAGALASAEVYNPANGNWSPAGDMSTSRNFHTATLLPNGEVLIAGGQGTVASTSSQVYNPANGNWSAAVSMPNQSLHTATLLPNGKVLVTGGGAQVYDLASNSWSPAGGMAARSRHTATLLPNGKVLIAGGVNGIALASVQVYDPGSASPTWSAALSNEGSMTARHSHTATLLPNGKVLIAGGYNGDALASAQVYDPANGNWSDTVGMTAQAEHTATLLPNGKVLIVGGQGSSGVLGTAQVYDPASNTWSNAGTITARYRHTTTLLPNGKVLIAGGRDGSSALASVQVYDPTNGNWGAAADMIARSYHTATLLPNGKVLILGGINIGAAASVQVYDPGQDTWSAAGNMTTDRYSHTATLLPNGKVLIAGGWGSIALNSAQIYDPVTGNWNDAGNMATVRDYHTATLLPNGKVLIAGGRGGSSGNSALASAEVYDPAGNTWSPAGSMTTARYSHTATLLPNGRVLIAGGRELVNSPVANPEVFSSAADVPSTRIPVLNAPLDKLLRPGSPVTLAGTGLHGDSEASGGGAQNSASNLPLMQLRRLDNGAVSWLSPVSSTVSSYTSKELPVQPWQAYAGWYSVTAFVNGVASNAVLMQGPHVPQAPGNVAPAASNAAAMVSYAAPANDGGLDVTGYLVNIYAAGDQTTVVSQQSCAGSPCLVTGLVNDTAYVFTVQAVNAMGEGAASPFSSLVTPYATADAPTALTAISGDEQVTLSWTAPSQMPGSTISGYTATAYTTDIPPQVAGTCSTLATPPDAPATSCTITGLTNGTLYNFTVQVITTEGPGASASSTAPVAPVASVNVPGSGSLPNGQVAQRYDASITSAGGVAPYHFSITSGQLPAGLSAAMSQDGASILISGTPTQPESQSFTVSISDHTVPGMNLMKAGPTVPTLEQTFTITVDAAAATTTIAPVPLLDSAWEKLLLSLALLGLATFGVRMRRVM